MVKEEKTMKKIITILVIFIILTLFSGVISYADTSVENGANEVESVASVARVDRLYIQTYPEKTVWAFSGFTIEQLWQDGSHPRCEVTDRLLALLDVLVDGRFVLAKKNISLRFRGSENQRLLDMPATLREKKPVLWDK